MIPSKVESFTESEGAFEILGIRNEFVEIKVVPELGGRILSLRDRHSGREWMDRPQCRALFRNAYGDDFTKGTFVGADECIPTVNPLQWKGRTLPDHGEVWSLGWNIDEEVLREGMIRTSVDLPVSPLTFSRTITLCGEKVQLDYEVTNRGEEEELFLWAHHPLYAIQPGDTLQLPASVREVLVTGAAGSVATLAGTRCAWPEPKPGIHLDELDLGGEGYVKCFAGPLQHGEASIVNRSTGAGLEMHWDAQHNPWLGIWLTRGAYMGFHHLAIEPTNGGGDALDALIPDSSSMNAGSAQAPLLPRQSRAWHLDIQLTRHPRNP
jgi:galactose mutarotase-like enzyme